MIDIKKKYGLAILWTVTGLMFLAILQGSAQCETDSDLPPTVLAVINGDTISSADLDNALVSFHSTQTISEKSEFDYSKLFDKLVNDRLIIQEAYALGINEEEWLTDLLDEYRKDNAIRAFVADDFRPDMTIPEEDILRSFMLYYDRMQVRTVSVSDSLQAAELVRAVQNGADMDSLARQVSIHVNNTQGGLHTEKYRADTEPALRSHAEKMSAGELSQPFRYRNAYAFLRLESYTPADTSELEKFRPTIERGLSVVSQRHQWDEFVAALASKYPIHIDTAAIESILADSALLYTPNFVNESSMPVLKTNTGLDLNEGDLRKEVARTAMTMGNQTIRDILATGLDKAEERLTLLAAAKANGYLEDERVEQQYKQSLDSALIEVYIKETVVTQITFNWAEFEEYYNEHLDDFRNETRYQLERIMITDTSVIDEVSTRLAEGADFDFIARQYDPNPERKSQANEWVTLASFPTSIRDDLEGMIIGDVSAAFEVSNGVMFLRIKDRQLGEPKPIKDVEMRIREVMFQRKFNKQLDKALAVLKTNSQIEYHQENIDSYFGSDS